MGRKKRNFRARDGNHDCSYEKRRPIIGLPLSGKALLVTERKKKKGGIGLGGGGKGKELRGSPKAPRIPTLQIKVYEKGYQQKESEGGETDSKTKKKCRRLLRSKVFPPLRIDSVGGEVGISKSSGKWRWPAERGIVGKRIKWGLNGDS